MSDDDLKLMPARGSETIEDPQRDTLASAVASQIADNIEDNRTLREWRPKIAIFFAVLAVSFYLVLLFVIVMLVCNEGMMHCAISAPNVCITVLLILAIIPTLLIMQTSRAVFGKRGSSGSSLYTPMQALIHIMKEMKN